MHIYNICKVCTEVYVGEFSNMIDQQSLTNLCFGLSALCISCQPLESFQLCVSKARHTPILQQYWVA